MKGDMKTSEAWRVTREIIGRLLIFSSIYMILLGIKYRKELVTGYQERIVYKVVEASSTEVTTPLVHIQIKWMNHDDPTIADGSYQVKSLGPKDEILTLKFCANPAPDLTGEYYRITYKASASSDCLQFIRAEEVP